MSAIFLLDTSVYLNVLDVPEFNQNRDSIIRNFGEYISAGDKALLPLPTILETGDHIARLVDGGNRFRFAKELCKQVTDALNGKAAFIPTFLPDREQIFRWLPEFPEFARRSKSITRTREGVSLSDLLIIKEWERTRTLHPSRRVWIWSLDSDLSSYDHHPAGWLSD